MKYYLGIDGGGTKTKLIVINEKEEILFENISSASSIDTVSEKETYNAFYLGLKPFIDKNPHIVFTGIFIGIGGIVFQHQKDYVVNIAKKLPLVKNSTFIKAENDMYNALYSGLLFSEGVALICGTGMVAFGMDKYNTHIKCGGWGYKEGEFGSGYHLGMACVQYMIRAFDGRYQKDAFAKEIAQKLNFKFAEDIIDLMEDLHTNRTKVASLAPILTKHANLSHPYALKTVELATDELALAVKGVFNQLKLTTNKIVIVGGLGNSEGIFKEKLHKKLKKFKPDIEILQPQIDPALAAAVYIKKILVK